MKIKYRQQHNNRQRFSRVILIFVTALIVLIIALTTGRLTVAGKSIYSSALIMKNNIGDIVSSIYTGLTPNSILLRENQELRTKLDRIMSLQLYNDSLYTENIHLRALLGTTLGKHRPSYDKKDALARVIDYKSAPYGTILAKLEGPTEVNIGDLAHFGGIAIGRISNINSNTVLIKLFTASNIELNVLLGDTPAIMTGQSNDSARIILSRTDKVSIGTAVVLPEADGLIVGSVVKIEHNDQDSNQTLLVQSPILTSQLYFISISHE